MKLSTIIDIDAYVLDTKISVEISAEGTWTDTVTDTYNAPSQNVSVPANSEIDVDFLLNSWSSWYMIYKK
ncbi:ETX/MTX2 family pore-forming toxin [Spiroplasma citri]|uniref:ETX/MTX2 family pore-forming toxin n=1 Tax=Spiroplasma citri TaxID=2133 RepID=UPI0013903E1F|nr:ETX/MTX2 family pore-forming toxin [Spiroplasma citri]